MTDIFERRRTQTFTDEELDEFDTDFAINLEQIELAKRLGVVLKVVRVDTKELADAQNNIVELERDVAAGNKRLRLAATCGKYGAASASSLGDASAPDLLTPLNRIISPSESESAQ